MNVYLALVVKVVLVNVGIMPEVLLLNDVEVHRCWEECAAHRRSRTAGCTEPNYDVLDDRCQRPWHRWRGGCDDDKEVHSLSLMFNWGVVLAVDVHDDATVKDVTKSQQRCFDVANVEANGKPDVVADEQDVFVAVDVYGLVGCCRKRKLSVMWLKRYVVCEVSHRCHRRLPSDEVTLEVDLEDVRDSAGCCRNSDVVLPCLVVVLLRSCTCCW